MQKFKMPKTPALNDEAKDEEKDEDNEELIEMYKSKIQLFMTDFKLLVKRNPNNWLH